MIILARVFCAGVKIEKLGDWFYLRYSDVAVRWDHSSSWFITLDQSASRRSTGAIEGLCGNYNADPYGTSVCVLILCLYLTDLSSIDRFQSLVYSLSALVSQSTAPFSANVAPVIIQGRILPP